jgi:hypothetical protein
MGSPLASASRMRGPSTSITIRLSDWSNTDAVPSNIDCSASMESALGAASIHQWSGPAWMTETVAARSRAIEACTTGAAPRRAMMLAIRPVRCSCTRTPGAPSDLPKRPGPKAGEGCSATQARSFAVDEDGIADLHHDLLSAQQVAGAQALAVPLSAVPQQAERDPLPERR